MSLIAYKRLVEGFDGNYTLLDLQRLDKYHPELHHDPRHHPLNHFTFPDLIRDWIKTDKMQSQ